MLPMIRLTFLMSFFRFRLFILLIVLLIWLTACEKYSSDTRIPAFIRIEEFKLETNPSTQGSNSHKIVDVWVFANDQTIGVFELPTTVPVLLQGNGKLRLEAGIKLNGIKTTRVNNPFYQPVIIEPFLFIPDTVVTVVPNTTYRPQTVFVWIEDFESEVITLDTTRLTSKTTIYRTNPSLAFEGEASGIISLNKQKNIFEIASFEAFQLPTNGSPVFLELNYKNDFNFTVGLFSQTTTQVIKKEIIYLLPQKDWNKIYINFTDKLLESQNARDFKVFFRTALPDNVDTATIFLDNIKLIYRLTS